MPTPLNKIPSASERVPRLLPECVPGALQATFRTRKEAVLRRAVLAFGLLTVATSSCSRNVAVAADFRDSFQPLINAACLDCHDGSQANGLDFTTLSHDLSDDAVFRKWQRVFDRVTSGEMPPESEPRPNPKLVRQAAGPLEIALNRQSEHIQQTKGRAVLRRLTRVEYEHTLNDMLSIHAELADMIPAGGPSGTFDTVCANQGFSAQHVRAYLAAADHALDLAIRLDPAPESQKKRMAFRDSSLLRKHLKKRDDGDRVTIRELDDAIVMFHTTSYLFKLEHHLEHTGRYILRAAAYPWQATSPVVLTLNSGNYQRGFTEVVGRWDLRPDEKRIAEVETWLTSGQYLFPGAEDLLVQADGKTVWNLGPQDYRGEGIALQWMEIEGPLFDAWPPASTTDLLVGVEVRELSGVRWDHQARRHYQYEIVAGDNVEAQIRAIVRRLATMAFRRPVRDGEVEPIVELGVETFESQKSFDAAVRTACRAVLTAPQFLFVTAEPGPLDDHALASRLSYFLWKTLPDEKLLQLAGQSELHKPDTLRAEVDRLLNDPRLGRFVEDFGNQWLRLSEIDETTPDSKLYPEYDDSLRSAMLAETRHFLQHLIDKNLSAANLIDSDFAFLNRRLAEHYDLPDVAGQQIRRVELAPDSVRGGLLTQASVMKVSANGTTTSPVRRGSWVLTQLLGTPPNPPPPSVGSIEPDTRGTTTIRELLDQHRSDSACASCHRTIDPPGFALECFDVIGGYRTHFRTTEGERPQETLHGRGIWEYKIGPQVDASGTLPTGRTFDGIREYKTLLLREQDQVARNLISQLVVYATGAEIQFADRKEIDRLVDVCRADNYGVRTMIREVVLSKLFLNK